MSREIKFRGISLATGEWVYGGGIDTQRDTPIIINSGERYLVDADTVGQFTGLLDGNSTEIYEGDVVSGVIYSDHSTHDGFILFDHNGYRIKTKTKSLPLDLTDKLKVICNIHQNPELLNNIHKN